MEERQVTIDGCRVSSREAQPAIRSRNLALVTEATQTDYPDHRLGRMREHGALLEVAPHQLSAVLNQYLSVKERNLA
jgi:hypothetical protein